LLKDIISQFPEHELALTLQNAVCDWMDCIGVRLVVYAPLDEWYSTTLPCTEAYCFVTSSLEMVCFVALIDSLIKALWLNSSLWLKNESQSVGHVHLITIMRVKWTLQ